MSDDPKKDKKSSGINISVGGNVEGEINASEGDMYIDKSVGGDQINASDIKDSVIAIGRGAQAHLQQNFKPVGDQW